MKCGMTAAAERLFRHMTKRERKTVTDEFMKVPEFEGKKLIVDSISRARPIAFFIVDEDQTRVKPSDPDWLLGETP